MEVSIVHHDGHVILRNTAVVASQFKFLICIGMYARRSSRCTHGQTLETDPSQRKAWKCKKLQISDIFTYLTFLVPLRLPLGFSVSEQQFKWTRSTFVLALLRAVCSAYSGASCQTSALPKPPLHAYLPTTMFLSALFLFLLPDSTVFLNATRRKRNGR